MLRLLQCSEDFAALMVQAKLIMFKIIILYSIIENIEWQMSRRSDSPIDDVFSNNLLNVRENFGSWFLPDTIVRLHKPHGIRPNSFHE